MASIRKRATKAGVGYDVHYRDMTGTGRQKSFRRKAEADKIDYVFVGEPFVRRDRGGRVLYAQIVVNDVVDGWPPSDHAGVLAEIVWPEERPKND